MDPATGGEEARRWAVACHCLDPSRVIVRCARCAARRPDMKPPFLCELQSEVGEAGHFFVVMLLMRGYVVEWETQRVEKDDRLDDRLDDRRVPVLGRGKGTPARVADIARLDDLIGPRSRGSVVLPKCRGCRRQHRIKKPRLYLLARDVLRRGGDTVYVGD